MYFPSLSLFDETKRNETTQHNMTHSCLIRQCGIIEVVPQARSRDQLGKRSDGTLYDYFISRYGPATSIEFQNV